MKQQIAVPVSVQLDEKLANLDVEVQLEVSCRVRPGRQPASPSPPPPPHEEEEVNEVTMALPALSLEQLSNLDKIRQPKKKKRRSVANSRAKKALASKKKIDSVLNELLPPTRPKRK